jgi:hypothetical protein
VPPITNGLANTSYTSRAALLSAIRIVDLLSQLIGLTPLAQPQCAENHRGVRRQPFTLYNNVERKIIKRNSRGIESRANLQRYQGGANARF